MQSIAVKASSDSAPDYRVKYVPGTIYLLSDLALYVMIDCRTGSGFMELPCRFICEGEKEITARVVLCGFESSRVNSYHWHLCLVELIVRACDYIHTYIHVLVHVRQIQDAEEIKLQQPLATFTTAVE